MPEDFPISSFVRIVPSASCLPIRKSPNNVDIKTCKKIAARSYLCDVVDHHDELEILIDKAKSIENANVSEIGNTSAINALHQEAKNGTSGLAERDERVTKLFNNHPVIRDTTSQLVSEAYERPKQWSTAKKLLCGGLLITGGLAALDRWENGSSFSDWQGAAFVLANDLFASRSADAASMEAQIPQKVLEFEQHLKRFIDQYSDQYSVHRQRHSKEVPSPAGTESVLRNGDAQAQEEDVAEKMINLVAEIMPGNEDEKKRIVGKLVEEMREVRSVLHDMADGVLDVAARIEGWSP